jgi:hypothetical protein
MSCSLVETDSRDGTSFRAERDDASHGNQPTSPAPYWGVTESERSEVRERWSETDFERERWRER